MKERPGGNRVRVTSRPLSHTHTRCPRLCCFLDIFRKIRSSLESEMSAIIEKKQQACMRVRVMCVIIHLYDDDFFW